jgi:hypothetical protein
MKAVCPYFLKLSTVIISSSLPVLAENQAAKIQTSYASKSLVINAQISEHIEISEINCVV